MIDITIKGIEDLRAWAQQSENTTRAEIVKLHNTILPCFVAAMKIEAPERTKRLRRSIQASEPRVSENLITSNVFTDWQTEDGRYGAEITWKGRRGFGVTRPRVLVIRGLSELHGWGGYRVGREYKVPSAAEISKDVIFTQKVKPVRPNPWPERGFLQGMGRVVSILDRFAWELKL